MSVEHLGKWDRVTNNLINRLILRTISKTVIIWELELRNIRRDYTDLFICAIQPILWLTILGVFGNLDMGQEELSQVSQEILLLLCDKWVNKIIVFSQ